MMSDPTQLPPEAPRDQQWMQDMCELVRNKIPASHTFVVFAFPAVGSDRCYYASNATRESAVEALKQWIEYQQRIDRWMTHDNEPPPIPPASWGKK